MNNNFYISILEQNMSKKEQVIKQKLELELRNNKKYKL